MENEITRWIGFTEQQTRETLQLITEVGAIGEFLRIIEELAGQAPLIPNLDDFVQYRFAKHENWKPVEGNSMKYVVVVVDEGRDVIVLENVEDGALKTFRLSEVKFRKDKRR